MFHRSLFASSLSQTRSWMCTSSLLRQEIPNFSPLTRLDPFLLPYFWSVSWLKKKKTKKKRKQSVVVVGLCCCSALGNIFFSTGSVRLFVRPSVCLSMCPNQVVWRSGPVMQCRGSVVPLIWWRRGITAWHSRPLHSLPFLSLKNNEKTNAANLSCSSLLCLCNPNQRNCQIVLQSGVLYLSLSSPNPCQSVPTLSSSTSSRSSSFSCVCLSPVLFFNLYLYFIFTKIYTNRLRIVINFN